MPANKDKEIVPIRYTSRDFQTIKGDLVTYAKTYYPDTFKDFSSPSFGSLMLDTVAYVGDILSFYVDYQANESFLSTANEFSNVIKLGRQMGYKFQWAPSASGLLTFYILVPAKDGEVGPDSAYVPVLKRGSKFNSDAGNIYTLIRLTERPYLENTSKRTLQLEVMRDSERYPSPTLTYLKLYLCLTQTETNGLKWSTYRKTASTSLYKTLAPTKTWHLES
jgi:hypothetical protein